MNRLRRHNVRSKIIDIIICGYELEDIESLLPEELYNNDFSFITLVAIMGATLKLEKFNDFEEWVPIFKKVMSYRPDYEMIYVWEGIYQIKKGNISKAINHLQKIVKKHGTRAIKNFYYFDNEVYDFYIKNMKN